MSSTIEENEGKRFPVNPTLHPAYDNCIRKDEKDVETTVAKADNVGVLEGEPKTYYSRLSVWLMILFSGLAIGSDG